MDSKINPAEIVGQNITAEIKQRGIAPAQLASMLNVPTVTVMRWVTGKRISIEIEQVVLLTSWETMYGITCVWKIVGKDGNVYTWKTGNDIPEEATKITGTVKEHKEYRGVKQTELTRCRVA